VNRLFSNTEGTKFGFTESTKKKRSEEGVARQSRLFRNPTTYKSQSCF